MLNVWASASAVAHPFLDERFLLEERRNIAEVHLPLATTWVWEESGRIAGFIALAGNEVGGLFVDPQFHRRGIGRALIDHVRGDHEELYVEVFRDNAIGRSFYAAYGFIEVDRATHEPTGLAVLRLRLPAER